jgi:hypothetical protein
MLGHCQHKCPNCRDLTYGGYDPETGAPHIMCSPCYRAKYIDKDLEEFARRARAAAREEGKR